MKSFVSSAVVAIPGNTPSTEFFYIRLDFLVPARKLRVIANVASDDVSKPECAVSARRGETYCLARQQAPLTSILLPYHQYSQWHLTG